MEVADAMIENVVGLFELPNAVAVNVRINGRDRFVPMVVEEPSVVAAVSNMSRLLRHGDGIEAWCDPSVMIGQIQVTRMADAAAAAKAVRAAIPELEACCAGVHPQLEAAGGGLRGMEVRELRYEEPGYPREDMLVLHFYLDCQDAMGANMVNTIAEKLAPQVAELAGGQAGLRILSNLADRRLAGARVRVPFLALGKLADGDLCSADQEIRGEACAHGIASAWRFAWVDPYRAATHNKGVMNGVDAVALATGNDWRAIEAGAHAYAARSGQYRPLSTWRVHGDHLVGELELPLAVGTIGGPIKVHPTVQANHRIAGVQGARDLSMLMAAVGLVQNLGALRALANEGIQEGHMRMHARSVAIAAGAVGDEIARTVAAMVTAGQYSVPVAVELLGKLRNPG